MHLQLNRGKSRHELARRLFVANQGAFRTGDYEEIMNKVSALALLSNAVLIWNTVRIAEIVASIEATGQAVRQERAPRADLTARPRARDPHRHLPLRPGDGPTPVRVTLASIFTPGDPVTNWAPLAPTRASRRSRAHTISMRSERPFHQGIFVAGPIRPASIRTGLWARLGSCTVTSTSDTMTRALVSRKRRKIWRAWARS